MIKVSIIVPAYNAAAYLHECMDSIVNQTLQEIEIIAINDGSTDETGNILETYQQQYGNVRVIHQKNHGLYQTREIGLQLSTGEYVGWVDADDFICPNLYERLYHAAKEQDSELVYCNYQFYPQSMKTKAKWFRPYMKKRDTEFIERNSQPWNKIVKRALFSTLSVQNQFVRCYDEIYIKLLLYANNPVSIDEELYFYRTHSGTMSTSYTNIEHYKGFVTASINLKNEIGDINAYWNAYFEYRIIYYMLLTMLVAANAHNKDEYLAAKHKLNSDYPFYRKNPHLLRILEHNFGKLKAFVIASVIPTSYLLSSFVCRIGLRSF